MRHEFKPGEMAVIVGAKRRPDVIGKVVQLVELLQPGQEAAQPVAGTLFTNSEDEPVWLVTGDTLEGHVGAGGAVCPSEGIGASFPRFLMPLRGDDEHDDLVTSTPRQAVTV